MENQANSKSIMLNYGFYLGIAFVFVGLIKYATGNLYEQEFYSGIVGFVLLILFIILGIQKYRTNNSGFISFGQSVKIGIGLTMIASLITILYYFLLATVIEPDFVQNSIIAQKTVLADSFGMSEGQIEEATKNANDNFYLNMFGGILVFNLFIGGVVSLIAGAIMKKAEEDQY
jgi:hypothetical protein